MSDRPTRDPNSPPGSWRAPDGPGGWRTTEDAPPQREPAPDAGSWRAPTLPANMEVRPTDRGVWHLPRPEDTTLTAEDERPIDEPPAEANGTAEPVPPVEAEAAPADEVLPYDEAEAAPEAAAVVEEPVTTTPDVLPFDAGEAAPTVEAVGDTIPQVEPVLPMEDVLPIDTETPPAAEAAPAPAATAADEDEDEEDGDTFSMSELVALASLVDQAPSVPVQPAAQAPTPVDDPAEVARRAYEALQAQAAQQQAPPVAEGDTAVESATAATDAAEIARQEAERLAAAAAPAVPALTPQQEELAQKYRSAEEQIRRLRDQFNAGQITREQLSEELRKYMVLDDRSQWWMMGVESANWYRHENGQWVLARPEVLDLQDQIARAADVAPPAGRTPAPTATSAFDASQVAQSLPVFPIEDEAPADAAARDVPIAETADQGEWVPRQVPQRDPEATIPGTPGVYLDRDAPNAQTVVSPSYGADTIVSEAQPTMANPALSAQEGIAAPIEATTAPDYEIGGIDSPTYRQAVERQRRSTLTSVGIFAAVAIGLVLLVGACGIITSVLYYRSIVSPYEAQIAALANYEPQFYTARIYAADNSTIAELTSAAGGAREEVTLDQISPYFVHAIVSTENERFFSDPGWDPFAIVRAFLQNLTAGDVESGASTITQQVARNLVLRDNTITPERKLQEIVVAAEIAQRYDKNFILQLYLNEIFFGNQSYGVEAASQFYFDHPALELNLPEAAMLAGLIQAPAAYDPVTQRSAAIQRMNQVLTRMVEVGCLRFSYGPHADQPLCITQDLLGTGQVILQKAQVEVGDYLPRTLRVQYPHFVTYIQAQVEQLYGPDEMFRRGFQIRTTLIPRVQNAAEDSLEAQVDALTPNGVDTGAVLVMEPGTGAIRAMVGSPDFTDEEIAGQVNNVFTWQQAGSAIKIVEYLAALEGVDVEGTRRYLTPASILWDVPTTYQNPTFTVTNADGTYRGPVSVRAALANSLNVPAVKAYAFVGGQRFLETAERLGLRFLPDAQFGLPTALGANDVRLYDMTQAYATLANNGQRVPPFAITAITDVNGVTVPLPPREGSQQVQPQFAFLMQNILSDDEARTPVFGRGSALTLPEFPGLVAAKTGTSDGGRDLWTMGFTRNMVVGVWLGTHDNTTTFNTSAIQAAAPVWNAVLREALRGITVEPFSNPGGVVQAQVCVDTGTLYDANVPPRCSAVRNEIFVNNSPPPPAGQGFVQTVQIDAWTRLRANSICPSNVISETYVSIDDPTAITWLRGDPTGRAVAQRLGLPAGLPTPPTAECSASSPLPQLAITNPVENQTVQGRILISGTVSAANLRSYELQYATAAEPNAFIRFAGPFGPPNSSTIAEWDASRLPNGTYRLRIYAQSNEGGFASSPVVTVNLINPTPTPQPTATPTSPPIINTPLPFETLPPAVLPPSPVLPPVGQPPVGQPTLDPFAPPTPTATIFSG